MRNNNDINDGSYHDDDNAHNYHYSTLLSSLRSVVRLDIEPSGVHRLVRIVRQYHEDSNLQFCAELSLHVSLLLMQKRPCSGPSTITENCGIVPCVYPRYACCPGFAQGNWGDGNGISCGPQPNATALNDYVNTCGVTCCPSQGIWSDWTNVTSCNDTCGSCGVQTKKRKCLSLQYGCNCTGPAQADVVCATTVCLFPRSSCCSPYKKVIDTVQRIFYCGPLNSTGTIENTTCCDPEKKGLWNDWSAWSNCTGACGFCGNQTRTRTCASAAYGCPCDNSTTTEAQYCNGSPCNGTTTCCAPAVQSVSWDGYPNCVLTTVNCTGQWTSWTAYGSSVCNDTCGNCGSLYSERFCLSPGCSCGIGAFRAYLPCNNTVCLFPRTSCCAPYTKKIVNRAFVCA